MAKVTLHTIAERAGVSYAAVSQVLSNPKHPRFSPETRERIITIAKMLNYRPNRFAKTLKGQPTRLLSMILPWNCPELMDAAERAAREAGYQLMVEFTPLPVGGAEAKAIRTALDWNVDGIIWMPYGEKLDYSSSIKMLSVSSAKIVFLHHGLDELRMADIVRSNVIDSTTQMLQHIVENGYRKIVCVGEQMEFDVDKRRFTILSEKSEEFGISSEAIVIQVADFKKKMSAYILSQKQPVAVVCIGNWFAVDMIELAEELGIDCPRQLGIVSSGDFPIGGRIRIGTVTRPRLTAIQEPLSVMASTAVELIIKRMNKDVSDESIEKIFPEQLIIRESTLRSGVNAQNDKTA